VRPPIGVETSQRDPLAVPRPNRILIGYGGMRYVVVTAPVGTDDEDGGHPAIQTGVRDPPSIRREARMESKPIRNLGEASVELVGPDRVCIDERC